VPVAVAELAKLFPFDALQSKTREQLAGEAAVGKYRRGEAVFRAGELDEASCAASIPTAAWSPTWQARDTAGMH